MSAWLDQARGRMPRIAEAAVERARLTVVSRAPRSRTARVPFAVLVSAVLVLGIAGLLLFNTSMQQVSFTTTSLAQRAESLAARQQSLKMELDKLRDPQRVAVRARAFGMVPAGSPAFLRLTDGRVLGDAAPATTANALRVTPLPTRKPADLRLPPVVELNRPHLGAPVGTPAVRTGTHKSQQRAQR